MRVTEHENNKFSLCLLNVSLFRSLNSACVFHFAGKKTKSLRMEIVKNLYSAWFFFSCCVQKTKSLRMEIVSSIK